MCLKAQPAFWESRLRRICGLFVETVVESSFDEVFVEVLSDEYEFLHAVAILLVPVFAQSRLARHELHEFLFGHGGIPLSGVAQGELLAGLFEDIADVRLLLEPADSLGTYDGSRPLPGQELIESRQAERLTAVVDIGADAVLLHLTTLVVMVMVVVMAVMVVMMLMVMVVVVIIIIVVIIVVMVVVMVMVVMVMVVMVMVMVLMLIIVVVIIVVIILLLMRFLHLVNPCSRGGHPVEVEHTRVDDFGEVYIAVVALYNLCHGLYGLENALDALPLFRLHLRSLVEENDVAELNLLDNEVFDILLADIVFHEVVAGPELIFHAQCVDHGDDAVDDGHPVVNELRSHGGNGADGLCDGSRFADAAGLDDDIVEALHLHDILQLLHEIHFKCAADASVLQCHEAVVFLVYDTPLLYKVRINVHFADIIHDDGEFYAALIGENAVEKRCLSAAQITGEQQYRYIFACHIIFEKTGCVS